MWKGIWYDKDWRDVERIMLGGEELVKFLRV